MNRRLPITVAMVIHNEAEVLARALASCADIVSDIVVVHDGMCTDSSLEIARRFGARVFIRPRAGAPEPHRPFSFAQAKHDWVLQLDADEYLTENFRIALPTLITSKTPGYKVHWIEESIAGQFDNMVKEVLFHKKKCYFIGAPNEYVKPLDPTQSLTTIPVALVNSAKQSNYESWNFYRKKYSRFAQIQAELYTKNFSDIKTWNYPHTDWDGWTKSKIKHPLLLGILGMNGKYMLRLFRNLLGSIGDTSSAACVRLMWYNSYLYWNVFTNYLKIGSLRI